MDISITQLLPSVSQAKLANDFSVKMLSKAMDNSEQMGQGIIEMIDSAAMERSVNPAVGSNFDVSV